ncbi:hypothetical protein V1508DRAFT_432705 [Lipomyces doorenjongii]|uniref:uncharacterized protein n=1 Tax=Lipomyces doorenjongii TaxID=383834 RepID=UPI0034CDA5B2
MAIPSTQASNACIYTTYGVFLVFGLLVAWKFSNRKEFLAAIRSQPAIPLAFNFIASVYVGQSFVTLCAHSSYSASYYGFGRLFFLASCFSFSVPTSMNDVNSMFSRRKYIHGQFPIIRNEYGPVRRVSV